MKCVIAGLVCLLIAVQSGPVKRKVANEPATIDYEFEVEKLAQYLQKYKNGLSLRRSRSKERG